jgi:hypothetical protein
MAGARAQENWLAGKIRGPDQVQRRRVPSVPEDAEGVLGRAQRTMDGDKQVGRGRPVAQRGEQLIKLPYALRGTAFQGGADVPDVFADVCDAVSDLLRRPRFATFHWAFP